MPDKPTNEVAKSPVRHAGDEALKELEQLAAAWIARQRQRLNAAS